MSLEMNYIYRKTTNQTFLFQGKTDLDGKLVETIMPFKYSEGFENYLEAIDEHNDEGSIITQEEDIIFETDKKSFTKVKESDFLVMKLGKPNKKVVTKQGKNCYIPGESVKYFFHCISFSFLEAKIDYITKPHKKDFIKYFTKRKNIKQ